MTKQKSGTTHQQIAKRPLYSQSLAGSFGASGSVIGSALHAHRAASRYELENDLRAWYLRRCRERGDPTEQNYFKGRREARRWFRALRNNQHFRHVVGAFRNEQEALSRAISLVAWLEDAQQNVNSRSIPYKNSQRLSQQDKLDADGGLREPFLPELDERLPRVISRRSTTIAGLSVFLGLPSSAKEVVSALRRHAQTLVIPSKPRGAAEIAGLLRSWEAPDWKE